MEQQQISIAKAGVVATLQARTAILAAATILIAFSIALLTTIELLRRRTEHLRGLRPN